MILTLIYIGLRWTLLEMSDLSMERIIVLEQVFNCLTCKSTKRDRPSSILMETV